ncbi:unnamed protein product [Diabrotica balteata]|uniref:Uncharacterized protein n=1 Tax=Diabrotica balteata TaxID=107213 RepID=A0A9N9XHU7_DIABA|nr:unnamed protein product [Diabrotica balteata]
MYDRVQSVMWLTIIVVIVSIVVCRGVTDTTSNYYDLSTYCKKTGETIKCKDMIHIISWFNLHPLGFRNGTNLEVIGTDPRKRAYLNPESYRGMHNWKRIRILDTNLDHLDPYSFEHMDNLESAHFINTGLEYIMANIFYDLPKLREVILTRNRLIALKFSVSNKCPMFKLLDVGDNKINFTSDESFFFEIGSILHINLNNNRLYTSFKNDMQHYPDRIRNLWYSHNKFTELRADWFRLRKNLRIVNFAYNQIEYVENNTFKDNPNLHTIILSYNKLTTIPMSLLPANFYPNLKYLAIDHNWIMGLDTTKKGPLKLLTNLKKISLAGNPFYCSCFQEVQNQINHLSLQEVCSEKETPEHTRDLCIIEAENYNTPCHLIPASENAENRENFLEENTALPVSFDSMYCALAEFINA